MAATTISKRGAKVNLMLTGARVFDPAQGFDKVADVRIEKGQITAVLTPGEEKSAGKEGGSGSESREVIDASGKLLLPGFVDTHAHLRTPGREDEEDIFSGTQAAAAGGYVTVCAMPNTNPVVDNAAVLSSLVERAESEALIRVAFLGSVSRGQKGLHLADLWDMAQAGAVAYSDDGRPVSDAGLLRAAFQAARLVKLPLSLHLEDTGLAGNGVMNEGPVSASLGLAGMPCAAESAMAARDLEIAMYEKATVHLAHISCSRTLNLIKAARLAAAQEAETGGDPSEAQAGGKPSGFSVTCEVTPHHLVLNDSLVGSLDPNLKMNPPLRSETDRLELVKGLAEGAIDCIGTDHAPHAAQEKETPFEEAAFGVVGLETAFPALYTELVKPGHVTLKQLVLAMSSNPAKIFALPEPSLSEGSEANLTLIDINKEFDIEPQGFYSKSSNTAFSGRRVWGRVLLTLAAGKSAFRHESL